jgi:uncharacterized protein (DUF488 family)
VAKEIYTLGTSTREWDEFLEILTHYEILSVIDIRRFPTSHLEHFKRENIQTSLKKKGIDYYYMGDSLGGYRKEGYQRYIETEGFQKALEEVEKIAEKGRTVLICAECLAWKCHRRFIGQRLSEEGWKVIHIIEKGREWKPS